MSKLRDSSARNDADATSSNAPGGIMGSTKVITLRKSASTFLQRRLSSRNTPVRANTLPLVPSTARRTSKVSSASILLPTNLCENPVKILQEVSDYFSQQAVDEVRSISDESSLESPTSSNSRTPSPLRDTAPSALGDTSQSPRTDPISSPVDDTIPSQESSSSRGSKKLGEVQSPTFPRKPLANRNRSKSEPTRKHKTTHLSSSFPCYSNVDLTTFTLRTHRKSNSISIIIPPKPRSKASPLSKEILFKAEEIEINIYPKSTSHCSKIRCALGTKSSEKKPRLVTQRKNNLENSNTKGNCTAKEILQEGIAAHQKNEMILSAILFEQCAKGNGECGVGMLMWALALRHGWGCPVDATKAFGWLQLSIETLLRELHQTKIVKQRHDEAQTLERSPKYLLVSHNLHMEIKGITSELLLALYELGQCLMYGWGCQRDNKLAVQYYRLAANLGDPDAQKEIAYCYEVGNGVKKSSQNAARYYRMAHAQGVKMMGYQWIWKDKYNPSYAKKKALSFLLKTKK